MLLFLSVLAFAEPVTVPSGLYVFEGREAYVHGFSIQAMAGLEDACWSKPELSPPTVDEWLAAAQQPGFIPSGKFESLVSPDSDGCLIRSAIVEAEGVDGYAWFGGWGGQMGSASDLVQGKGNPKAGIIKIHANPYNFWGDDAKPAPRGARCVLSREPVSPEPRYVDASTLNIRKGRGPEFEIVHKALAGAAVTPLHTDGEWVYLDVAHRVWDDTAEDPSDYTYRSCTYRGWTLGKFLAATPPDPKAYAQTAEAALKKGDKAGAITPLERASALHPENSRLREDLADLYQRVASEHTAAVRDQVKGLRAKGPLGPWQPEDPALQLATWCKAEPTTTGSWPVMTGKTDSGCALPWGGASGRGYTQSAPGWIDLDPSELYQCADDISDNQKAAMVDPKQLYVRIPGIEGDTVRAVHVSARTVLGDAEEGEFESTGMGPWRTVELQSTIGVEGAVVAVPMKDLLGEANHAVQLQIEIYAVSGTPVPAVRRLVDLIWPVSC